MATKPLIYGVTKSALMARAWQLARLEEYQAEEARLRAMHRVDELQAAADAAEEARYELWTQIADTPAKTVVGLAIKLAAVLHWDDSLQDAWTGESDTDMGEQMILAARADALKLAGLPRTFGIDEPEVKSDESQREGA